MADVEELRHALDELEECYEAVRDKLIADFPNINPCLIRDTSGRYILIDSLTTIVQVRSALTYIANTT